MEWINKNAFIIGISFAIGILIGMGLMDIIQRHNTNITLLNKPDTTYNKITLDSIKVQVGKHDTTIYKLKLNLKDDVEKSYQLNDSNTVDLFKRMVADK